MSFLLSQHSVHRALSDQSGNLLRGRGLGLGNQCGAEHPVILHLLLAAEPFAASVALVEAGDVTPLMDHQVVSLAEASVTPTTVKGFSNWLNLERLFPVYNFGLVHVYAEADSKHLEYLGSGFTLGWSGAVTLSLHLT